MHVCIFGLVFESFLLLQEGMFQGQQTLPFRMDLKPKRGADLRRPGLQSDAELPCLAQSMFSWPPRHWGNLEITELYQWIYRCLRKSSSYCCMPLWFVGYMSAAEIWMFSLPGLISRDLYHAVPGFLCLRKTLLYYFFDIASNHNFCFLLKET
jgi:hypothetical protein